MALAHALCHCALHLCLCTCSQLSNNLYAVKIQLHTSQKASQGPCLACLLVCTMQLGAWEAKEITDIEKIRPTSSSGCVQKKDRTIFSITGANIQVA